MADERVETGKCNFLDNFSIVSIWTYIFKSSAFMRPMPTSLVVFTLWLSFIVYIIDSPGVIYAFLLAAPTHCNKIKLCLEMIPWSSAAFNIDFVIKSSNCDFNVLIDSELALKMLTSSEFSFNWAATLSQCLMRWSVLFINFPLWFRCVNEWFRFALFG